MRLVVLGGNGFLGSQICRSGVIRGWKVTSLSRSGSPKLEGVIPDWATKVNWCRGDLMDPNTYKEHLFQADAVVHSVGALMSSNYKSLVDKSICEAALKYMAGVQAEKPVSKGYDVNKINYETVKILNNILKENCSPKAIGYVSATPFLPSSLIGSEYVASKRAAEQTLLTTQTSLKTRSTLIFRPGLMYSDSRPIASNLASAFTLFNSASPVSLPSPLRVELVAEAIAQALQSAQTSSKPLTRIYAVNDLQALAR